MQNRAGYGRHPNKNKNTPPPAVSAVVASILQTGVNFIDGGCAVSLPLLYGVVVVSAIALARYDPLKSAMTRLRR